MNKFYGCLQYLAITFLLLNQASSLSQEITDAKKYLSDAHFKITNTQRDFIPPFTATIGGVGNTLFNSGSGFEPIIYRNKYSASRNSDNRVYAEPNSISHWDTLQEGALDGADVYIYRIENGRFNMVRKDQIPNGGFHVSGWIPLTKNGEIISPEHSEFKFRWDNYNRAGVDYYFTVKAIDYSGNLSPDSNVYTTKRPAKITDKKIDNKSIKYKPSKLTLDSKAPPAPKGLKGKIDQTGNLTLNWDAVDASDLAGYIVFRSDYPPNEQKGYYFDLSNVATTERDKIKTDDMIIVSKKFYEASRNKVISNRVWGAGSENKIILPGLINIFSDESDYISWELAQHDQNTIVKNPGETYLKVKLAFGQKLRIGAYNHSGTAQNWYSVLKTKPYTVDLWMKKEGQGSAKFLVTGYYQKSFPSIHPINFNAHSKWEYYKSSFTPGSIQKTGIPNEMVLELTGPGTFSIDNLRVYESNTDFGDLSEHDYQELANSGMRALRSHSFIKSGSQTYDFEQLSNPAGVIGGGTQKLNTLPQTLAIMRKAQVDPWLQVALHMAPQEWLGFVEYISAPFDPKVDTPKKKPWAYKRFMQGQSKPWAEEFKTIYFELSNETWNRVFSPWTFNPMTDAISGKKYSAGQVYGMYQEYVMSILRSSPYWKQSNLEEKFKFIIGGWANSTYGRDAVSTSPLSDYFTIAAYNGGWDVGEGPTTTNSASLFNVLTQVAQDAIPTADKHADELIQLKKKNSTIKAHMGTYEAGPGYALNGLNNAKVSKEEAAQQEKVMKSLAAGTATLDSFLARAYRGFTLQNFFTFNEGDYWKSHAQWYNGGQAYPSWMALALFNNQAVGHILETETLSVPKVDLKPYFRRPAMPDAPLIGIYATNNKDRYAVFVISRKIPGYPIPGDDGYTPVSIDLPFSSAKSVQLFRMSGNPLDNNISSEKVKIESVTLDSSAFNTRLTMNKASGADERGIPPASLFLYVFQRTN